MRSHTCSKSTCDAEADQKSFGVVCMWVIVGAVGTLGLSFRGVQEPIKSTSKVVWSEETVEKPEGVEVGARVAVFFVQKQISLVPSACL